MIRDEFSWRKAPDPQKVLLKALKVFDHILVQGSTFFLRLNLNAKNPAFGSTESVGGDFDRKQKGKVRKMIKH